MSRRVAIAVLASLLVAAGGRAEEPRPGVDWPSFRGIRASGVAEGFPTATTFDVASGAGVKWKTAIAGLAHSSPVIWGDRLLVTTAISA